MKSNKSLQCEFILSPLFPCFGFWPLSGCDSLIFVNHLMQRQHITYLYFFCKFLWLWRFAESMKNFFQVEKYVHFPEASCRIEGFVTKTRKKSAKVSF